MSTVQDSEQLPMSIMLAVERDHQLPHLNCLTDVIGTGKSYA